MLALVRDINKPAIPPLPCENKPQGGKIEWQSGADDHSAIVIDLTLLFVAQQLIKEGRAFEFPIKLLKEVHVGHHNRLQ